MSLLFLIIVEGVGMISMFMVGVNEVFSFRRVMRQSIMGLRCAMF